MQIKIYTIPILGGELLNDELNRFLRSKKVLKVEHQLVNDHDGAFWCFCVKYLDDQGKDREKKRVDYKQVLDDASFERFSKMRETRRQIAQDEAIPAYAVFTDEELAALARIKDLTTIAMKSVKGIGEKKVEKYGVNFISTVRQDEKR